MAVGTFRENKSEKHTGKDQVCEDVIEIIKPDTIGVVVCLLL